MWNLRSSDDRAFDRQSKGPGLVTQRSGSVPFFTENFFDDVLVTAEEIKKFIGVNIMMGIKRLPPYRDY